MKTEEEIIDEVYENKVYGICTAYFDAMISPLHGSAAPSIREISPAEKFKAGIKIMGSIRDRAKALLKEVP